MSRMSFTRSPFYLAATEHLLRYGVQPKGVVEEAVSEVLSKFNREELDGLSLYIIGISVEDPDRDLYKGMSLEDFLFWVDRNPEGFGFARGVGVHAALIAGINAAKSKLTEADKAELHLDELQVRDAIAAFYHSSALQVYDDSDDHTPIMVAFYRILDFFTEVFEDFVPETVDEALDATLGHFGLERGMNHYPEVWW